jgi:hypothetical protein
MTEKINSGIYQLSFRDGTKYIGKSTNLEEREVQHRMLLLRNRGSEALQAAYKKNGLFFFDVIVNCHPDWLDIAEAHFINEMQPKLNTTIPELRMDADLFDTILVNYHEKPSLNHSIQELYIAYKVQLEEKKSGLNKIKLLEYTVEQLEKQRTKEEIETLCGKEYHDLQDKYCRDIKELNDRLEKAYRECEPWYIRWFRKIRP